MDGIAATALSQESKESWEKGLESMLTTPELPCNPWIYPLSPLLT